MHIYIHMRLLLAACVSAIAAAATATAAATASATTSQTYTTLNPTYKQTTTATTSGQLQMTPTFNNQQQMQYTQINNQIATPTLGAASSKKGAHVLPNQSLSKFQKYLSEHQQELVTRNPGSLWAVARAVKMAIKECQYQMRNEPWDCPIYGFSVRPSETFGMLMSRSFKQTSFIQALLSSAIAHSVARACTESIITTCTRKQLPLGKGFGEDIDFGQQFAREFMNETAYETRKQQQLQQQQELSQIDLINNNLISNKAANAPVSANSIVTGSGEPMVPPPDWFHHNSIRKRHQRRQIASSSGGVSSQGRDLPVWKEKRLRKKISEHNEQLGRLIVLGNMRRECKCHGISGACSMQTCWDRLPPFRDVAAKLHDSLDRALRVEMYVAPLGGSLSTNRHKSLTSVAIKKSNKKRSSSPTNPSSGFGRSAASVEAAAFGGDGTTPSASSDSASPFNGGCSGGRLQGHCQPEQRTDSIDNVIGGGGGGGMSSVGSINDSGENDTGGGGGGGQSTREFAQNTVKYSSLLSSSSSSSSSQAKPFPMMSNSTSIVKKRPIARSIGLPASTFIPGGLDLLYAEQSPDFCLPNDRYSIKGTRGRVCSENSLAPNSCETLCCGRGYKTEIREEKYSCECKFELCCNLKCNTCKRQKVVHKCL